MTCPLMRLSFASILGGVVTVLGTSSNLIVSDVVGPSVGASRSASSRSHRSVCRSSVDGWATVTPARVP